MGHVVLSGTYQCVVEADDLFLTSVTWVFGIVWKIITLCPVVWIVVKHFRELRISSIRRTVSRC
jgi:hypothetical protein